MPKKRMTGQFNIEYRNVHDFRAPTRQVVTGSLMRECQLIVVMIDGGYGAELQFLPHYDIWLLLSYLRRFNCEIRERHEKENGNRQSRPDPQEHFSRLFACFVVGMVDG